MPRKERNNHSILRLVILKPQHLGVAWAAAHSAWDHRSQPSGSTSEVIRCLPTSRQPPIRTTRVTPVESGSVDATSADVLAGRQRTAKQVGQRMGVSRVCRRESGGPTLGCRARCVPWTGSPQAIAEDDRRAVPRHVTTQIPQNPASGFEGIDLRLRPHPPLTLERVHRRGPAQQFGATRPFIRLDSPLHRSPLGLTFGSDRTTADPLPLRLSSSPESRPLLQNHSSPLRPITPSSVSSLLLSVSSRSGPQ